MEIYRRSILYTHSQEKESFGDLDGFIGDSGRKKQSFHAILLTSTNGSADDRRMHALDGQTDRCGGGGGGVCSLARTKWPPTGAQVMTPLAAVRRAIKKRRAEGKKCQPCHCI